MNNNYIPFFQCIYKIMNQIDAIFKLAKNARESLSPVHKVLLSFIILILSGALLLMLPASTVHGISFINALFTSTSAVCVTGLIVVDTAKDFTLLGKIIILLLIQFGGLGIMTFSIAILSLLGGSYSIKWQFTFASFYSDMSTLPIRNILKRIILYTFSIELTIAFLLFLRFIHTFPFHEAAGHALFHAVSAFCNAGFSSFSDNLTQFRSDYPVLLTVSAAVILGGLGFLVLTELFQGGYSSNLRGKKSFTLHTKIVLSATAFLLIYGTLSILLLEWNYAIRDYTPGQKIITAFFHSVSCRTAGFNTIDIGLLRESTLFIMSGLMFIGGSPGSIAGGIKTTTIAVILGVMLEKIRGGKQVIFGGRSLSNDTIDKSTTLIIVSLLFVYISTFLLLFLHSFDIEYSFLSGLFEIVSAFGTVGLSTGITSNLYLEGKIVIICVMLTGRLGPLILITALNSKRKEVPYELAEENIMIG